MWQKSPEKLTITDNEVHVWRANLDLGIAEVNELEKILNEAEKERANKFYFEQHKNRFIVARGNLRLILGKYLEKAPEKLEFEYSEKGKPSLKDSKLQFNVSHSQDLALYGFTWEKKIGVDLEYLKKVRDIENIAERFFTQREAEIIKQLPDGEKITAFVSFWTGKEAYLKAIGEGIGGGLDNIEIDLNSDILRIKGENETAASWCLFKFIPREDYLGAVVVEKGNLRLSFWE